MQQASVQAAHGEPSHTIIGGHMPCSKSGLPAHLAFLTADHNPQMALQQSRS
jgi:hypothetical protein